MVNIHLPHSYSLCSPRTTLNLDSSASTSPELIPQARAITPGYVYCWGSNPGLLVSRQKLCQLNYNPRPRCLLVAFQRFYTVCYKYMSAHFNWGHVYCLQFLLTVIIVITGKLFLAVSYNYCLLRTNSLK